MRPPGAKPARSTPTSSRARDRPRGQAARGPRLFERACRLVRDGIRHQRPGLTDEGADALLAARFARRLSRLELPRHPTFHGIADFVIETAPGPLQRLQAALPSGLTLQPRVSFEAVRGTVRHLIVLTGSHVVCELFALSDDPHDRARFDRRKRCRCFGRRVFVASAEDMIVANAPEP